MCCMPVFDTILLAVMLARERRRTNPLMAVLMMELLARNLRRVPQRSAQLERAEYALRDRDILWYLLRIRFILPD